MGKMEEFLLELEIELQYLKPKDANDVIKYYRDRINIALDYGETIEHILAKLPTPQKIAEETYKSKGTDYLALRKKQLRKKQIINAIFSAILLVMIFLAFLAISFFLITSIIRLFALVIDAFTIEALIDKGILILFTICYILLIVVAIIYIFDLFYMISMYFLQNILDAYYKEKKDYAFMDFTISGTIETKINKKKFLGKILIGLFVSLFIFGIGSYVTKGYIYRSMNNITMADQTIDVTGNITEVTLNESKVFLKISQSEEIMRTQIRYGFEFAKELKYEVKDGHLIIDKIMANHYDIFGFLDEPIPLIELVFPSSMSVYKFNLNLTHGILDIVDLDYEFDLNIKGDNTTIALTRNKISNLDIDGYNLNVANEENQIAKAIINFETGRFYALKDQYNEIVVENSLATLILQEVSIEEAKITCQSAQTALDKVEIDQLTYRDLNSESYLRDAKFTKASISAEGSSKISLERVVATAEITLKTISGTFDVTHLKTKKLVGDFDRGTLGLYNLNQNTTEKDANNPYLASYNTYTIDMDISITSNNATIQLGKVDINQFEASLESGKLEINTAYLKTASIKEKNAALDFADLDGETIKVDVDGGNFYYYNDIESNIILTIEGELLKTNISIGDNIKRGE